MGAQTAPASVITPAVRPSTTDTRVARARSSRAPHAVAASSRAAASLRLSTE